MNEVVHGSLKWVTSTEENNLKVAFFGKSDAREPANVLTPFFDDILQNLTGELTLEFDRLEFMNSSTLPPIAQFLHQLEKKGVRTTVVFDGRTKWQFMTFNVLKKLTAKYKNISIVPK